MSSKIEIGQRFGFLEILERAGTTKTGGAIWRCKCHRCGGECTVESRRLTSGNSSGNWKRTDCGCTSREKRIEPGKIFGGIEVLRQSGNRYRTMPLWIVRCCICGKEREMRSSTILRCPTSCGCKSFTQEDAKARAKKAVEKTTDNGTQLYVATKTTPNKGNTTGYRWVRCLKKKGNKWYFAVFFLQGERYYRGGFESAESAHDWASSEHARLLKELGIEDPRKKKED